MKSTRLAALEPRPATGSGQATGSMTGYVTMKAGLGAAAVAAMVLGASGFVARAQQPGAAPPAASKPSAPAAQRQQKGAPKAAAENTAVSGGGAADSGLKSRVEQLEEQLVDMQVVVGTLESLAKSGGGGSAAASAGPRIWSGNSSGGASDGARLDGMETQIRALTSQIEQLSEQVRQLSGATRRGDAGGARGYDTPAAPPSVSRFGSTTVTAAAPQSGADPIGGLIDQSGAGTANGRSAPAPATPQGRPQAALAPPPGGENGPSSKQLYETAYGYLLQQDYGAAEAAFDDFLQRFPQDALAGNAQYWHGESHFVRGQYKAAAGSFLKGYQTYGKSPKAPDSLLKLAMSLERLGQKDAACASFSELGQKFPNAPVHVKTRAETERRRVGCP